MAEMIQDASQDTSAASTVLERPAQLRGRSIGMTAAVIAVLSLLALLGWGLVKSQKGQVKSGKAPDFTLTGFDGRAVTLGGLPGLKIGPLQSPELDNKIDELLAEK